MEGHSYPTPRIVPNLIMINSYYIGVAAASGLVSTHSLLPFLLTKGTVNMAHP